MELTLLSLLFALIALGAAWYASSEVAELIDVRRRLRALESELPALEVDLQKVLDTLRRIEGRQTARDGRRKEEQLNPPLGEPDSRKDPQGWKLWKNRQLVAQASKPS